jgi:hypothetical protein
MARQEQEQYKEPGVLRVIWDIYGTDLKKGCSSYTRQTDAGTGKTLDLCFDNRISCPFYDGTYQTHGETEPSGKLSQFDVSIGEGVQVGFCRLQKDAIRFGPLLVFDKKWLRPTPPDKA